MGKLPIDITLQDGKLTVEHDGTMTASGGTQSNQIFSIVTVESPEGTQLYTKSANGGYSNFPVDAQTFPAELGTKVKIYYRGNKEDFRYRFQLNGKEVTEFGDFDDDHNITYVVTEYGLLPESIANNEEESYKIYKERVTDYIESYLASAADTDYLNPFLNPSRSNSLLAANQALRSEDQSAEAALVSSTGYAPEISLARDSYEFDQGTTNAGAFQSALAAGTTITDREEGPIPFAHEYVRLDTSGIDWSQPGQYSATLTVTDRENNTTTRQIPVNILAVASPDQPAIDPTNPTTPDNSDGSTTDPANSTGAGNSATDSSSSANSSSSQSTSSDPASPNTGSSAKDTAAAAATTTTSIVAVIVVISAVSLLTLVVFHHHRKEH